MLDNVYFRLKKNAFEFLDLAKHVAMGSIRFEIPGFRREAKDKTKVKGSRFLLSDLHYSWLPNLKVTSQRDRHHPLSQRAKSPLACSRLAKGGVDPDHLHLGRALGSHRRLCVSLCINETLVEVAVTSGRLPVTRPRRRYPQSMVDLD